MTHAAVFQASPARPAPGWWWGALLLACQADRVQRPSGAEPPVLAPATTSVESARPSPAPASSALPSSALPSSARPAPASIRPSGPLNVILITVDAWRADMPWLTASTGELVPQLTRWVKESVLWENHRAVSSHTPQSLAALSSGRMPCALYRDGGSFPRYSPENVFLPEVLQARGIRTLAVQTDDQLQGKGFEQGFDVWERLASGGGGAAEPTSERAAEQLITLLGRAPNTAHQFFAWLHLDDPREPYLPAPPRARSGASARARYDAELQQVDAAVGKLLAFAAQQRWWGRTAVIVTGSHGEAFGEHGMSQHGHDLWDVLLKTPLIIRAPGAPAARLAMARSQIDLAPTIVELMGLPRQEQYQGQSLLPELYGAAATERPVQLFELCEDVENPGLRAMIAGDEKLVVPGRREDERLFNLKTDPGELKNLAESQPARLRALAVRFEGEWRSVPGVEPHGGMRLRSGRLAQGPERPEAP